MRTKTGLGKFSAEAYVQSVWADPVQQAGTQENEDARFRPTTILFIGQSQNPEQSPCIAKLQWYFSYHLLRHSARTSSNG
jgi:hypothetical protein